MSFSNTIALHAISFTEVDAVVAYLAFVDQTGTYPPQEFDVRWYGTVEQEDDPQ